MGAFMSQNQEDAKKLCFGEQHFSPRRHWEGQMTILTDFSRWFKCSLHFIYKVVLVKDAVRLGTLTASYLWGSA
jgi:hypothetical protein